MVASSIRSAARDCVLISLSVAAIVLAWWPRGEPRQVVQVRGRSGNTTDYAIPLDDPRLGQIRQQVYNAAHPGPPTEWVLARWRHRLATHYIEHAPAPQHGAAAPADGAPADGAPADGAPADGPPITDVSSGGSRRVAAASENHWAREKARAEQTFQVERQRRLRRQAAGDVPPVELGPVLAGPRRPGAWLAALASGLLAAVVFAHWRERWPAIGTISGRAAGPDAVNEDPAEPSISAAGGEAVRVEIPAQWVRIRQPWPVALRRWAMAAVVTAALCRHWIAG